MYNVVSINVNPVFKLDHDLVWWMSEWPWFYLHAFLILLYPNYAWSLLVPLRDIHVVLGRRSSLMLSYHAMAWSNNAKIYNEHLLAEIPLFNGILKQECFTKLPFCLCVNEAWHPLNHAINLSSYSTNELFDKIHHYAWYKYWSLCVMIFICILLLTQEM